MKQIPIIKLCDFKYDRCAEFILCVDVETLRPEPRYSFSIIFHRLIVEYSLANPIYGEPKRGLTGKERRSFLKLLLRYKAAQLMPFGRR